MRTLLIAMVFCLHCVSSWSQALVLHGISADRALVSVKGRHEMLRFGRASRSGLLLHKLQGQEAEVEWRGQRYQLTLNRRINSHFQQALSEVAITRAAGQSYVTPLRINRRSARAIVDTGASVVAMNQHHAAALGLDYSAGRKGLVTTASGQVEAWFITVPTISVGAIKVANVRASVVEGAYPVDILLGMSFLSHVTMQERQGILYLGEKD